MAPRANWKGYLKLSLVSCPVACDDLVVSKAAKLAGFHN